MIKIIFLCFKSFCNGGNTLSTTNDIKPLNNLKWVFAFQEDYLYI